MYRTLIDSYVDDFPKGISQKPYGPINKISQELAALINKFPNDFNNFFINKLPLSLPEVEYLSLKKFGLIVKVPRSTTGEYISNIMCHKDLIPLSNGMHWYIFTDWPDVAPQDSFDPADEIDSYNTGKNMVFPIHYESVYLCNRLNGKLTPDGKDVLDIFCGSGVLGIYAALNGAKRVHFVDNNVRALTFTLLNLAINLVTNEDLRNSFSYVIQQSNIFEAVDKTDPDNKYGLILANPPFEPVPAGMKTYFQHSYGGEDGQTYLKGFIEECLNYINEDGSVVGVDFSPGTANGKEHALREILNDFTSKKPTWQTHVDELDDCNLYEFASRYLALGIDIEDYHKWLFNLSKHNYVMLYFCWFVIGKDISSIKKSDERIKINWANPLNWNYPCGITDKNKLPWIYLEDSFFIRENIFSQQLKNERMLSNQGMPEYFPIAEMIKDDNFNTILRSFTESLQDFQYGTLGKPQSVTWMSFPEYHLSDEENGGIIFWLEEECQIRHALKSRKELREIITNRVQNDQPKIMIFYDIYNRKPDDCNSYFGEFASCTMSLFISEGNNIVHEINLGKIYDENLLPFIQEKLSKISFSVYKDKQNSNLTSLQTFCFILDWHEDTSVLFHNLLTLNLNNKIIFDGLNKRLLFIISQGLNSLAMVGLIGQQALADALAIENKKLEDDRRELSELIKTVRKYSTDILNTASIVTITDSELRKKAKWARKIKLFDETLANIPCATSFVRIEEFCRDHNYDLAFPEYKPKKKSLRHMFLEQEDQIGRNEVADMINKAILQELREFSISDTYKKHIEALHDLMKISIFGSVEYWPLLGEKESFTDYWKGYIAEKLKVTDNTGNIYEPIIDDLIFSGEGAVLMPFLCYPIDELFASRDKGGNNRYPPERLNISIISGREMTSINLKWNGILSEKKTIKELLESNKPGDLETQKLSGRLWFLSQVFPKIDGEGFRREGEDITFSFNIHCVRENENVLCGNNNKY